MIFIISNILSGLLMIVPLLIAVAYTTLMERKVMAAMQQRRGPNVVGIYGLLQPLADGLKLLSKETVIPTTSNFLIFVLLFLQRQRKIPVVTGKKLLSEKKYDNEIIDVEVRDTGILHGDIVSLLSSIIAR